MTEWNFDLTQAPRGKTVTRSVKTKDGVKDVTDIVPERVWLASKCGKVIPSYWVESRKNWAGFQDAPPVAWQPYLVPEHPFADTQRQQGTDGGAIAEVKVTDRLANANGVEPSSSDHFILDDVGGGE